MKPRIVIVGANFAGLHAAFELHHTLGDKAEVIVTAPEDNFVFLPSLIWVIPGWRNLKAITFDLQTALEPHGISFLHATTTRIELEQNRVITTEMELTYDYLVIATGADPDWDAVPGLGPHGGHTHYVCTIPNATTAESAWRNLLADPGPVVLGATQSTGCYGLEYEMVFNLDYALRKAGIREQVPMTLITSEPFIGHLGVGGVGQLERTLERLLEQHNITYIANARTERITPTEIHLDCGRTVPFKYSIVLAPFKGRQFVFDSPGLGDERGFIPVNARYQHIHHRNVYAAGVAVAVKQPDKTPVPCGVPKTGYMSDVMGKVAAQNIEAEVMGKPPRELDFADLRLICFMDGGDKGVAIISNRIFAPRTFAFVSASPIWHLAKVLFERYYMWKVRTGRVYLP